MNTTSGKSTMLAAILGVIFIAYNVSLFVICGFSDHTSAFWVSYAFMLVAFIALTISGILLGQKGMFLKDWFFGLPLVRHSTIYICIEFVVSTLFIVIENNVNWAVPFVIQFVLLCIYIVCAISCFLAKKTISTVKEEVAAGSQYMKLLLVDSEMLAEKCQDEKTKQKCLQFAETVRFSDPLSPKALSAIEDEISAKVSLCDSQISLSDYDSANATLDKLMLLLAERNKKCMALK